MKALNGVVIAEDTETLAKTAVESSNLYGFLALVFRDELSAPILRQIRSPAFREALSEAGVALDAGFLHSPEETTLAELAVEYTALFLGPGGHVSPYESVQTEGGSGRLWGPETAEVKRFIEAVGFDYKPEFHGLPDHVSVELDFISALVGREAAAWRSGDLLEVMTCLDTAQNFLAAHLGNWAPIFCAKVADRAQHQFYRDIARLTANFLEFESDELRSRLIIATALNKDAHPIDAV